jgi:hypothetical protein
VAASVWQSLIFLVELPFLAMFMSSAYPADDLTTLFGFDESGTPKSGVNPQALLA